uniref:Helicase n=1 Tax=viral metagenome TaxID=1070528 RepID=A0A6M3L2U9_9ZZZZ
MPEITIRKIDSTNEKRVITGMIVSDHFLKEIIPLTNLEYFQNKYAKTIASWCLDFFENYEKAPFNEIQNIFQERTHQLSEEERQIISLLLKEVSDKYKVQSLNVEYLIDQAIGYFKKRELEITANNIKILLDRDDLFAAEKEVINFHKISPVTSQWINPLTTESVNLAFKEITPLLLFEGQLGRYIGPLARGWLVGISGPFKRGKSYCLDEFGINGMVNYKKVVKFSLEMNDTQNLNRYFKKLSALSTNLSVKIPVFDCSYNQFGSCEKSERKSKVSLMRSSDEGKPRFDPENELQKRYIPCTSCMHSYQDYKFASWWSLVSKETTYNISSIISKIKSYEKSFKEYYRLRCYPRFSANVDDIYHDLDILERREGFIPDIILIDYVDILKPERKGLVGIEKEDESWMALARLASERHCLVVTPTQVTREGTEVSSLKTKHMARWVGKLGHVDAMLTINQTSAEKRSGYSRIGMLAHRHMDFDEDKQCYVLQSLDIGQFYLDSYIAYT